MRLSFKVLMAAIAILLLAGIFPAPGSAGAPGNCDKKLESQWPNQPEPKAWEDLYRLFKQFGVCDGGAIGDRFSRDVAQLFSKQWSHLDTLGRLAAADKAFEQFVLRHIDKSLDEEELLAISDNSMSHCPTAEKRLCGLARARAQKGLDAQRDDVE
jgi:hypothetical protein